MPDTYHLRRAERDMPDRADQLAVIRGQKFLTLAMSRGDEPYLISLNYAYDERENCFYVHSAPQGKKLDFLRANPRFWGQIVEDGGYIEGKCAYSYRCVMFSGRAEFVTATDEKLRALFMMIDQADAASQPLKADLAKSDLGKVLVIRLRVEQMSGKAGH
jgi:nitroimidazol reductase NimA-like FMN-containing flavoprotein (pyridoxamine 5'-phosphate oxidase superfamily)